jgi:two-component system response regulator FixJ
MAEDAAVDLIDDDEAVRQSLAFLLDSSGIAARTHESATAFLAALPTLTPACIVTDVRMPGMTGLELLRELRARGVDAPVIVITGHGDVPLAVEAMKGGAADFLEKPFDDDALLATIRAAIGRQARDAQRHAERDAILERLASLSGRERDVLAGLVAGHANKMIAYDLGISPRTVEIYRANLMTKMDAASLSHLVRMAMLAGFARPDGD